MTHDEAVSLLPAYALGALDQDVDALEMHLQGCDRCTAELATYLEATVRLGEAVQPVKPPLALREAVLARAPARSVPTPRSPWWAALFARLSPIMAVAATLLIVLGATIGAALQQQQLQSAHTQIALDERGLALLTSTETNVVRLEPVVAGATHGHWYHRPGVDTQVLVTEFMPPLAPGEAYYGWLRHADGSWTSAGKFSLDAKGYGRLILVGGDGSDVRQVEVTRQTGATEQPAGEVVLHWSGG